MVAQVSLDSDIRSNPDIRGGKPRIEGTRITVSDVALSHLHFGMPFEQIGGEYQHSLAAVHSAMAYYYDHREAIDQRTVHHDALAEKLEKESAPFSKLKKLVARDV